MFVFEHASRADWKWNTWCNFSLLDKDADMVEHNMQIILWETEAERERTARNLAEFQVFAQISQHLQIII
jgi:hypothetical protein